MVVITAWGRSGTTFLGELLQRNGRFLYIYEPLRAQFHPHYGAALERWGERSAGYLVRLADCALHLRDRTFLFKDKPGLARGGLCGAAPSDVLQLCRCKHIAVKTIRINGQLEHLLHELRATNSSTYESGRCCARQKPGAIDVSVAPSPVRMVHILHLIRDPRALLNSWQHLPGFDQFKPHSPQKRAYELAHQLCTIGMRDYAHGRALAEPATAGAVPREVKYTLLRFEDLALRPVATARSLYRSLGLELPARLLQWVNESTHASMGAATAALADANDREVNAMLRNPHTTVRDSNAVVFKWRKTLHPLHIRAITQACTPFLEKFDYPMDDTPAPDNVRVGDSLLVPGGPDNTAPIGPTAGGGGRPRALTSQLPSGTSSWHLAAEV